MKIFWMCIGLRSWPFERVGAVDAAAQTGPFAKVADEPGIRSHATSQHVKLLEDVWEKRCSRARELSCLKPDGTVSSTRVFFITGQGERDETDISVLRCPNADDSLSLPCPDPSSCIL